MESSVVITPGSGEKVHIKIVNSHFVIGSHESGQSLSQVINIIFGQFKRTANRIHNRGNVSGHPQWRVYRQPAGAADFAQKAFAVGFFGLHQVVPVIIALLFEIRFCIVEFLLQKMGRIRRSKYL